MKQVNIDPSLFEKMHFKMDELYALLPKKNGTPLPEPIPIDRVRLKVAAFYRKMNWIAQYLEGRKAEAPHEVPDEMLINKDDLKLEFYIDRRAVARLVRISMLPEFEQLGVFYGLQAVNGNPLSAGDKEFGQFTGIFVGLDKERNVLDVHFPARELETEDDEHIDGEDTWPPPPPPDGPGKKKGKRNGSLTSTPPKNYFSLATDPDEIDRYFAD
jgi:hypothetical protein